MNTRRYPRTTIECHGMRDAAYASSIERPARGYRIIDACLIGGLVLFVLMALLGMLPGAGS